MRKEVLIITDLTRMHDDRVCLAGLTRGGECIRPVLPSGRHFTESWLYQNGTALVRPFAAIEFELERPEPEPPHTEDWLVRYGPAVPRGEIANHERARFLTGMLDDDVPSIFGAPIHHDHGVWVAAHSGDRSLGTIRARVWEVLHQQTDEGGWDYRLVFTDSSGDRYKLKITDLAFRYFVDRQRERAESAAFHAAEDVKRALKSCREVYLRIGLARHWAKFPERCYLQVNGMYTFPDYLNGRCFADFAPRAAPPIDLEGLPF